MEFLNSLTVIFVQFKHNVRKSEQQYPFLYRTFKNHPCETQKGVKC